MADPLVKRQQRDLAVVLPQVHALDERLLVAAALGQRRDIDALPAATHPGRDGGLEVLDLFGREQVGHDHVAVALERLDDVRSEHGAERHRPSSYRRGR